jgi:D-3-phosphoglycerate dehydrogenase
MHVLIAGYGSLHPDALALLDRQTGLDYELMPNPTAELLTQRLPKADGLLVRTAPVPSDALAQAARLRVVSRHGVGYDNVPLAPLNAAGIPLAIIGDVNSGTVAEHTSWLMLTLAKNGLAQDAAVRQGHWSRRDELNSSEIEGKRLLLLGFGKISKGVARRAQAFGMKVTAYDPYISDETMSSAGVESVKDWRTALPESDYISLHLPSTSETKALIGCSEFAAMKPGAFLINTARGDLVDEDAMIDALKQGRLGGAGLDTFNKEPLSSKNPLVDFPNVVLTPHSAALTTECLRRMGLAAVTNLLDGLAGCLDPTLVVNPETLHPA